MAGVEWLQRTRPGAGTPRVAVALVGPGNVGSRLLARMTAQRPAGMALVAVANSTRMLLSADCLARSGWRRVPGHSDRAADIDCLAAFVAATPADCRIVVDATASKSVAERHAGWLRDGFHVVTANKWAASAKHWRWPRSDARRYFHATTVGAGLPILSTLDGLRRAGDRVVSIEGVLSGTLSYLTARVAAGHGFADSVHFAREQGLTEPDPRLDLSGVDVARKLVIAARAAGLPLGPAQVAIDSLVPAGQGELSLDRFLHDRQALDDHWQAGVAGCPGEGSAVCHVGCVATTSDAEPAARVGLRRYDAAHPFARICPGDNIVAIRTDTYGDDPIWIRGRGAGSEVTALQLWSQVLAAAGVVGDG